LQYLKPVQPHHVREAGEGEDAQVVVDAAFAVGKPPQRPFTREPKLSADLLSVALPSAEHHDATDPGCQVRGGDEQESTWSEKTVRFAKHDIRIDQMLDNMTAMNQVKALVLEGERTRFGYNAMHEVLQFMPSEYRCGRVGHLEVNIEVPIGCFGMLKLSGEPSRATAEIQDSRRAAGVRR